jgi:hypothetical protein
MNLSFLHRRSPSKLLYLQTLLAASVIAAGSVGSVLAAGDPTGSDTNVIARVGDTEIKLDEIRASIESLDSREQAALARDPSLLNQTVRTLLMRRVVLKEALANTGIQNRPSRP